MRRLPHGLRLGRLLPSSVLRPLAAGLFRPAAVLRPQLSVLWLLASVLCLLSSACVRHETNVQRGDREQVLHRGIGPELPDLDPHLATGTSEYTVLSALLEGLVSEDPVDLHPVPGVAERWEISPDGLVYTFHLRPEARWSNGEPVTAHDFIASFRRMLTPSLGADYAPMLYAVANAEAYHQGRLADFAQVGLAAPDEHTLSVTLDHPIPYFLAMLNHTAWLPVPVATIARYGPVDRRGNPWTRPGRFVGNGPFVLKAWRSNQAIVVEKSPTYWDAARVRLRAIYFHTFDSVDAEERAFRAGQLHLTEAMPPAKIDAYRRDEPQLLRIDPYLGIYFYRLNVTRPYLDEPRVRRALALAVDREAIVEHVLRGGQLPAHAFTPPGMAGYTPPAGIPTDFAAARRLLEEAGYPGGRGLPVFELLFNISESHQLIAEAIQEMWRRELGVEVRLVNQELKSTLDARRTGNYQILRSVWIGDYADPASFLGVWASNSGNNYTGWSSPDYDRLLDEAARTADPASRNSILQRAEALLLKAAPLIPIHYYTHVFLIRPSVHGWNPTLLDHHPYKYVWLEE
ncbi:MAG TPA: peptide ABC transporter substrate-binding protein [Opitutaceae bacterium]|nr:peptide ABC transporter substrate-binding protein [Opitutaceae bacterium]